MDDQPSDEKAECIDGARNFAKQTMGKAALDLNALELWTYFVKRVLRVASKVFVEATELGDVLATGGLPFAQGVETPLETSTHQGRTCLG